jgi:uncharacterized protein
MQAKDEEFPSVTQAVLLLVASFLLQYLVAALLYDFRGAMSVTEGQAQALVMVLANGLVLVAVMQYRRMTYRDLVHPSRSSVAATLALLVPPVLMLVPLVLLLDAALTHTVQSVLPLSRWEEQAFASMAAGNLATVVAGCVLAPILEELLFRGVLLRAFLRHHPRWAAISYSALLFGAAHMNVYQFLLAFLLGLLLGWLYERSQSLLPCIALHAALNTSITVLEQADIPSGVAEPTAWALSIAVAFVGGTALRRVFLPPRKPVEVLR